MASKRIALLGRNDKAEITGVPLMLMILAVVAGIALVIIMGWVKGIGGGPDGFGSPVYYEKDPSAADAYTLIERIRITDPTASNPPSLSARAEREYSASSDLFVVQVLDRDGAIVPDAVVTLSGAVTQPVVAVADDAGYAAFEPSVTFALPPQASTGNVNVKVEKSGWSTLETTLLVIR